ncbi:PBSX family phage terminase large subunit [Acetonema longum]|uniref:Putative phage terminase, large subunit n=1 Tax=Acetonema longum DSM 6540 TaxID=1009370 RepID=F7NK74_9FIRM|nr:PBSX family phage terminase large subunit [Acetonema longum]EGO63515.1 putative phage terminase, large subunit [Acetonema longum DSM 6540]
MANVIRVQFNPIFREFNRTRCRYRAAKGSAGSGKSVDIAQDFVVKLMDDKYAGANLLVVRKIDESNRDSTYAEVKAAINRVCGDMASALWTVRQSPLEMVCNKTGNKIIFRGMKDDSQREKIKSVTFERGKLCWIWLEEATEFDEDDVDILDDRLRGELLNPNLYYQMTFSFNPVDANHWIKAKYFDIESPDIFTHHSTYRDNRFIDEAYYRRMELRKIQDPEGYKVYGEGEWGVTGGRFFTSWSKTIHVCKPFAIPTGWLRFRSMDWGSYRPYAVGWYAVDYDSMIWKYRELYGYGGKPNVGTGENARQVAMKIVEAEKEDREISYGVLDSACWNASGTTGPTVAEEINNVLSEYKKTTFAKSEKGRENGAEQLKLRLDGYKGRDGKQVPGIVFFETCFHNIRTIPVLTHDKRQPEKVDTTGEDHCFDETAYALTSRPWTPKKPEPEGKRDAYSRKRDNGLDWMAM